MITVGLVDDQPLFRSGIRMIIDSQPDLSVVWEASDGREALEHLEADQVDVVLMDLEMPGMGGIEATRIAVAKHPQSRVIVLTTFELDDRTFEAIRAGASGFLLKSTDPEFLLAALRTVHAGTAVVAPTATVGLVQRFARRPPAGSDAAFDELTAREQEIFASIVTGLSNSEIAAQHHVSDATVKTHVSRILAKLGLRDRVQLVIFAYENGLAGDTE